MSDIAILTIGGTVVVPISAELHDDAARSLQAAILERIETIGADGLLIDVSAVSIIDSFLGRVLVDTARMARLMGAETVLAGMKMEVVLTLVQLGVTMSHVQTALNLEDGLARLARLRGGAR